MDTITIGADGYYHPTSDEEIRLLILRAREEGLQVRVRGSGHSIKYAIFTDSFGDVQADKSGIQMMLDQLNFEGSDEKVRIDKALNEVRVKAGCHLGMDPYDPAGVSSLQNSLLYQLDQQGLAVPDLGGIIHQAVGGFLATGSSGGSLMGSFGDQLTGIKLISGTGEILDLRKDRDADLFFAAGVSMGLLGIITEATFTLVPRFDIIGEQTTTTVKDCPIDLFGDGGAGKPSLEQYLNETQYARLMWWPQNKVERMEVWKARDMKESDYNHETGTPKQFKANPYLEFPAFGTSDIPAESGSESLAEGVGGLFYSLAGNWHLLLTKLNPSFPVKLLLNFIAWLYPGHILPAVIKAFVPLDTELDPFTNKPSGPRKFWDVWWHGLPMDNDIDDKLMPTDFTEIWIPISKTSEVMSELRDFYAENGYSATGSYSCELYAARRSEFWMSPSYGQDMFRVDVFWFGYNEGDPAVNYYPQFWDLLTRNFECRFHWGKHMPVNPDYLARQYPKWKEFMALRERMDPKQIFVTQYWRDRLGIEPYTLRTPLKPIVEEGMSKPAKSIFYFGFYMILEVVLLLWCPPFLMKLAGIDPSAAVWLRMIAGIIAGLTIYYFRISLKQIKALYPIPVYERTVVFVAALLLYLLNHAPFAVLGVGIVDLLGAIWTFWAIKSTAKK